VRQSKKAVGYAMRYVLPSGASFQERLMWIIFGQGRFAAQTIRRTGAFAHYGDPGRIDVPFRNFPLRHASFSSPCPPNSIIPYFRL